MKLLNRNTLSVKTYPERVLQFGGGNFLRAFVDWIIDVMNKEVAFQSNVIVIKPTNRGNYQYLKDQDGLFTVLLDGIKNGKWVSKRVLIECISKVINPYKEWSLYLETAKNPNIRFIISNTTEIGIKFNDEDKFGSPYNEFPAKLTQWLYVRYKYFKGDNTKGCILLPCELIVQNGEFLKKTIQQYIDLWKLGLDFRRWIDLSNYFCNTLVDRIVSGYPQSRASKFKQESGYKDNLLVEAEIYHRWVIQGPPLLKEEFPVEKCNGLNIIFTNDISPYRTLKVRILNGAHTTLVPAGYLYGIDSVRESVEDQVVCNYLKIVIFNEICPTLNFSEKEINQFANDVLDRFRNRCLEHKLMSISLNSISKFKNRVLPSIVSYIDKKNNLPKGLLFSLAALIVFYKGNRAGESISLKDEQFVLDFFAEKWTTEDAYSVVKSTLKNKAFWEIDLTNFQGLQNMVTKYLETILNKGMKAALEEFIRG